MATPGDLEKKAEYDGNALEAQHSLVDAKAEAKQDIDSHVNHTAAVSPAVKNCVALAKQILEKYDPSRVENGDLERLLERYQGNEEELIERLCRKYNLTTAHTEAIASMIELGPSVTQSVRLRSKEKDDTIAIKHKLAKIYGAYDRRMLRVLDAEMSRNKGRERAYLEATMRKYKVTYDWLEKVGNAEDLSDNLEDGASRRKSVSSRKLNSTFVNPGKTAHERTVYDIYAHYAPDKLGDVPKILERHKGTEAKLMSILRKKYLQGESDVPIQRRWILDSNYIDGGINSKDEKYMEKLEGAYSAKERRNSSFVTASTSRGGASYSYSSGNKRGRSSSVSPKSSSMMSVVTPRRASSNSVSASDERLSPSSAKSPPPFPRLTTHRRRNQTMNN